MTGPNMDRESEGMLEKMKRGIRKLSPFASEKEKQPVATMNFPARLGRTESAYECLVRIFQSKLFLMNENERSLRYCFALELVDEMISNLNYIGKRKETSGSDFRIPVLHTLRNMIEVLRTSSEASREMKRNERETDLAGGPLVIAKLRLVDDAIGDMEIGLLHHIAELLDFLTPMMKKASEQLRKQLSRNDQECFEKNYKAFSAYYSQKSGIAENSDSALL